MISVIIANKDDRRVEKTIKRLIKIPKPEKTEIIVVDASEGRLEDIRKSFPKVRWIDFHNKTNKKRTFVEQINLGSRLAEGDILVYIDADCAPTKDWLIELTDPLRTGKEDIVAGKVKSSSKKSLHYKVWKKMNKDKYIESCPTMNMAITREVLNKIGPRDENFNYGSDIDFSWRAIDKGYRIKYFSKAIIYHDWGNLKCEINRSKKYGEARFNLHMKHKNRRKNLHNSGFDLFTLYSTIFFFYIITLIPLTVFFRFYPLFLLIPLLKNIKKRPLKKMIFDFFWGYGFVRRVLIYYLSKNATKPHKK